MKQTSTLMIQNLNYKKTKLGYNITIRNKNRDDLKQTSKYMDMFTDNKIDQLSPEDIKTFKYSDTK